MLLSFKIGEKVKRILKFLALIIVFMLTLTTIVGCSQTPPGDGTETNPPESVIVTEPTEVVDCYAPLTLMSFNIRTVASESVAIRNWANRKNAVIKYINEQDASVICMQEVKQSQYNDLNGGISGKYGLVYYGREGGSNPEGLAIAYEKSVWELKEQNRFWLSATPDTMSKGWGANYYRICVNVLLRHRETGVFLKVFNVHLDHEVALARENGMKLIMSKVNECGYPVYVAGDFNCTSTDTAYTVTAQELVDCQSSAPTTNYGRTYTGWSPADAEEGNGSSIDFAFVSKEIMTPVSFKICRDKWASESGGIAFGEGKANFISDHYAIKVNVLLVYKQDFKYPDKTDDGFDSALDFVND